MAHDEPENASCSPLEYSKDNARLFSCYSNASKYVFQKQAVTRTRASLGSLDISFCLLDMELTFLIGIEVACLFRALPFVVMPFRTLPFLRKSYGL